MRHLNLSSRLRSEPLAIRLPALRDLIEKSESYLAGRLAVRVPEASFRSDLVGPIDWDGQPMIPQLEVVQGVGVIRVHGALFRGVGWIDALFGAYDYDWLAAFLAQALEDSAVTSLVIEMASPGGSHVGMEETSMLVAQATQRIPTFVFSSNECCSAAYGLAIQAGAIFASPSAIIGCLGSKLIVLDSSDAYRLMGLRVETYTAGANGEELALKAMYEEGKPITDAERAFFRETTQYSGQWVKSVVERRPQATGVSFEGGWVFGRQALADGLIDSLVNSLPEVIAAVAGK